MNLRGWLLFILIAVAFTATVFAQSSTGSISGAVSDPNGAVVPAAKIEATETATGRVFATLATDAGVYVFPTLPVGIYTISTEHPGFKKLVRTDVEIRVGFRQNLDLKLEVGDVQQSVSVAAELPLLET